MNKDFKELLVEIEELNWTERLELVEVLKQGRNCNSTVFDVLDANGSDTNFIIKYSGFSDSYLLTEESAKACLREFEKEFCQDEDAESYCNFQIAKQSND